jgi:uncharacterized membrane protein
MALMVVFAALYAVGVVSLAPISFGVYQVRLADALLPLSMIFGIPSVVGLSMGCAISNVYGGLGMIDIVGGTVANFVATFAAWYVARNRGFVHRLLGSVLETLAVTLIVGGYLTLIFEVPLGLGLFGILVGSIISINVVGFPVEEALRRSTAFGNCAD